MQIRKKITYRKNDSSSALSVTIDDNLITIDDEFAPKTEPNSIVFSILELDFLIEALTLIREEL